ncbi:MAG: ATP-binding protein [Myxococcota bacterium]
MRTPSTKAHIAFGQVCLLATLILAAEILGLVPNRLEAERRGRTALAEAVAANGSALITRSDVDRLENTLRLVVERNPDVLSAAVSRASGRPLVTVGDHHTHWRNTRDGHSTDTQIQVPLWSGGRRWGRVEMRFAPLAASGWWGLLADPRVKLLLFLCIASFVTFYFYLGRLLRYLDPSQAVPTHVRSALDTLAEGLLVLDRKHQIVLANAAFAETVGSTPDSLLGRNAADIGWVGSDGSPIQPDDYPWARALKEGSPQRNDMACLIDGEAERRTFLVNSSPVLGSGGEYGGVLVSLDDVTQLEEHKASLKEAKEEAEAANQAKTKFLANMSHEIRTPMNAILGFTEVLKRGYGRSEAERRRHLDTIHSSGEHLLQLINDLLDLSKVEAGRLEIEQIRVEPHRLIQEVVHVLGVKAREKQISLDLAFADPVPATILSDPTRLRQILTNLISNAIKFTEQGGVKVIFRLPSGAKRPLLQVDVIDSGIGIPEGKLEGIFDPFVQADTSVTRRFGGTGLGLSISRRFARLMGGDITVTSEAGRGSTFSVTADPGPLEGIELLAPEAALEALTPTPADESQRWVFPNARILVVDDGEENRELLELVLGQAGLRVECARNGQEAVERAAEESFNVILMDVQMPVMDGFTAASILRERGLKIPIFALTAHAMKGIERETSEAGFSGHIAKPVDLDGLLATLAETLGVEPRGAGSPRPGASKASRELGAEASPIRSRLAANLALHPTIRKFVPRLGEQLEAMDASWQAGDFAELAQLAHWLKGSAGTVGFDAFSEPARTLELLAKERKQAEIEASLEELRGLFERIELPGGSEA